MITKTLGLELNKRLFDLIGRTEYGYKDELCLIFSIDKEWHNLTVSEEEFSKSKRQKEIAIICRHNPTKAVKLCVQHYPKATLMMRKDPELEI